MNCEDKICGFDRPNFEKGYRLFNQYVSPCVPEGAENMFRGFWNNWSENLAAGQQNEVLTELVTAEANVLGYENYPVAKCIPELLEQVEELTKRIALRTQENMNGYTYRDGYLHTDHPDFRTVWEKMPWEYKGNYQDLDPEVQSYVAGAVAAVCDTMIRLDNRKELEECEEDIKLTWQLLIPVAVIAIVCAVIFAQFFFNEAFLGVFADSHEILMGTVMLVSYFGAGFGCWAVWELGHHIREEHTLEEKARERALVFA